MNLHSLVIAGWTGRDAKAVEAHIRELEAIGVRRPSKVPLFYRVSVSNLTHAAHIQVAGRQSTGEVEFVIVSAAEGLRIGVGSDHTDRELEKHSVSLSKQVCAKPMAQDLWRFDEVAAHWDELELRSYAHINGARRLYQQGFVTAMLSPAAVMQAYGSMTEGTAMFCGTLPVHGDIEFADRFEIELIDARLGRTLRHAYKMEALPLAD